MLRLITLCCAALLFTSASAQDYPTKPIRMVVQFSAGGGADFIARLIGREMELTMKQPVIVDNRPGANGTIANQLVAVAPADGYTLLVSAAGPMVVNPHLYPRGTVDTVRDFIPIAGFADSRFIIVVHPSVPVRTVQELTALAKSKPGTLNFSTSGLGGSPHLAAELYKSMAGVNIVHVPYKGMSPAIADLVGGIVQLTFSDIGLVAPFLESGKLRAIASTGLTRAAQLPDLPTLHESGLSGYQAGTWYGLHGPANMPAAIVTKLNTTIRTILADSQIKDRLHKAGLEGMDFSPAQFAAFQQRDYDKWSKLIKSAGIKVD